MERRRQSQSIQQKRYLILASSVTVLVLNIAIFLCYCKVHDLLFEQYVQFWIFFVSGFFILSDCFIIFAFYKHTALFVDATLFLSVLLLIFQFLCGMIATCSVVIEADAIAENVTSSRPESKKELIDMMRFENDNGCRFEFDDDVTTTSPTLSTSRPPTAHGHSKLVPKSCAQVIKEKSRNIAVFLSTGYILIIVMLSTIIMLMIS